MEAVVELKKMQEKVPGHAGCEIGGGDVGWPRLRLGDAMAHTSELSLAFVVFISFFFRF